MKKHNYFTILLVAILAMIVVTSCIDDVTTIIARMATNSIVK